jgi:hypothetical protein
VAVGFAGSFVPIHAELKVNITAIIVMHKNTNLYAHELERRVLQFVDNSPITSPKSKSTDGRG